MASQAALHRRMAVLCLPLWPLRPSVYLQKESASVGQRGGHHLGPVLCRVLVLKAPWTATGKNSKIASSCHASHGTSQADPGRPGAGGVIPGSCFLK